LKSRKNSKKNTELPENRRIEFLIYPVNPVILSMQKQ